MKSALHLLYRCSIESLVTLMDKCEIPPQTHLSLLYNGVLVGLVSNYLKTPNPSFYDKGNAFIGMSHRKHYGNPPSGLAMVKWQSLPMCVPRVIMSVQ